MVEVFLILIVIRNLNPLIVSDGDYDYELRLRLRRRGGSMTHLEIPFGNYSMFTTAAR